MDGNGRWRLDSYVNADTHGHASEVHRDLNAKNFMITGDDRSWTWTEKQSGYKAMGWGCDSCSQRLKLEGFIFVLNKNQDAYGLWLDASCEVTKDNLLVGLVQAPHFETPDWRIWTCHSDIVLTLLQCPCALASNQVPSQSTTWELCHLLWEQKHIYLYYIHVYACGVLTLVVYIIIVYK